MKHVAVIDYGLGNLYSVCGALRHVGLAVDLCTAPAEARRADGWVLPGVGTFDAGMTALAPWVEAMRGAAQPLLGICLGMQMLFAGSEEGAPVPGLSLLPGRVARLSTTYKLPHIGWNALDILRPCALTEGIENGAYVYFVHSYAARPERADDLCALTRYGAPITALVARGVRFGCQFHPEKSGDVGLQMLQNFGRIL